MPADPHAAAPELKRLRWLVRVAFLWALVIFGKLAWLQIHSHENLIKKADKQQEEGYPLQPPRGIISTRDGAYLAVSVPAWSVIVDPRKIANEEFDGVAQLLAKTLHLDAAKLKADLTKARDAKRGYLRVKAKAEPAEYQALKDWVEAFNSQTPSLKDDVDWVTFTEESWRAYPNRDLGAPVVGAVDGHGDGYAGIEREYQKVLSGKPGFVRMLKDSQDHNVNALEMKAPEAGQKVTLTIDSQLQFLCDRSLAAAVKEKGFATGTITVMNPNTGEIYAMSSYPSFDPNVAPKSKADVESRVHRAVAQALDGGSVMKLFTIAGALEHTRLRPSSLIDCGNGEFRYSKKDRIGDTHAYGVLPVEKVLWFSSNVGAIKIGIELKKEKLYQTLRDFGFGQTTGIDLPGESRGTLRPLDNPADRKNQWQPSSIYYVSMGHELGITTIQLAQACSVIANGGYRVKPKLVLSTQAEGAEPVFTPESPKVRVLRGSTAVDMRNMSEGVVLSGTGKKARIAGRTVGGKTGTAQMVDRSGHYAKVYSSSFMGYAPLHAPKVVVVVTLNGGKLYGGDAAAPVFSVIADAALNMLGEPADVPMPAAPETAKPAVAPEELLLAKREAAAGAEPATLMNAVSTGAEVPDFTGLDKRTVARMSAERGLPVKMLGAGLVRSQFPAPGSVLALGNAVQVRFAR